MGRDKAKNFQKKAKEIASFLEGQMAKNIRARIITHTDPDGISAGNIIARCLEYYDVPFHISFGGPLKPDEIKEIAEQDYDLFIFADQGSGQFPSIEKYVLETDRKALILDHHPGEVQERPDLAHINPHSFGLNGAKDVSASGVAYSVVEKINEKFSPLSEMALIGAVGDRQEFPSGFSGINKEILEKAIEKNHIIVREGLKLDGRTSPIVESLSHSIRPYLLGLSGDENASQKLVEDLGFEKNTVLEELDLEEEEMLRDEILERIEVTPGKVLKQRLWGTLYTPKVRQAVGPKNIHEYVTMLDACEKLEKLGAGFSALLGDENSRDEALGALREYQNYMIDVINWFISNKDKIKTTPRMRYIYVGDELESKILGEALSITLESNVVETDRLLIGLVNIDENKIKASARGSPEFSETGADIGEILKKVTSEIGGRGGGHDVAAAARFPRKRKEEFIEKVDLLLKDEI